MDGREELMKAISSIQTEIITDTALERLDLVPLGSTLLRVTEFPVVP